MKVFTDWAECLRDEGRLTLQIPQFAISDGDTNGAEYVEAPDEWFFLLKGAGTGSRVAVGKEQGFLYITPAGYAANKARILDAWVAGATKQPRGYGTNAAAFDHHARRFYAEVERRTEHAATLASTSANRALALRAAATYFPQHTEAE